MNYSNHGIRMKQKELHSGFKKASTKVLTYVFKIFITVLLVVTIVIGGMGFGALKGILETAPEVTLTDVTPSQYKTTVYDCNGIAIETLVASGANRIYVTYDEIPEVLVNAFIAIEDERFWTHNGIDAKGIIRAVYKGISSGLKFTQGASTITQQLIKNSVFAVEDENSLADRLRRKVQEQYMALKLEEVATKEQIMENYLNTINLGNNNLGVQAASINYFNKDVSELTLSEAAVIASITQNPSKYNPIRHPDNNAERRQLVLDNMLEQGLITEAEYKEALEDDVYDRIMNVNANSSSSVYSYYTDSLIGQLMDDLMEQKGYTYTQAYNLVYRGGLSIYSCEDYEMQTYAEDLINNDDSWGDYLEYSISVRFQVRDSAGALSNYTEYTFVNYMKTVYGDDFDLIFDTKEEADQYIAEYKAHILEETDGTIVEGSETVTYTKQPQCSFVAIENGTGEVRVIIGGRGDKEQSLVLNRATGATRMPGSTLKPLLSYGPAIDLLGYGTGTVIDDAPYYWDPEDPDTLVHNGSEGYFGYLTIRSALAASHNIPAIKTLAAVGVETGMSYLESFGFTTLTANDHYLPTAIGTCNVTNYELTAAYSTYANGGVYVKPKLYTKVLDHDGNVILDNTETESHRVVKESTAWIITEMLHSVAEEGTVSWLFNSSDELYFCCKSGTSQDYADRWLAGFAGNYSAAIWCGFDSEGTYDADEDCYYGNIWKDILITMNANDGVTSSERPEMPSNIIAIDLCSDSGLLPVEGLCDCDERGSRIRTEYFVKGTEPTEYCNVHQEVTYCNESGDVASPECYEAIPEGADPSEYLTTRIRIWKALEGIDLDDPETPVRDAAYAVTTTELENGCRIHGSTFVYETDEDETETTAE